MKDTFKLLIREKKKLIKLESKHTAQKKIVLELSDKMIDLMASAGTDSYKNKQALISVTPSVKD